MSYVIKIEKIGNVDVKMLEQNFKVTEDTTFLEMRDAACDFWDL